MMKNITMGQYYPVDSWVHRLDPRTKILLTIAMIVAVFLAVPYWKQEYFHKKVKEGRHA